MWYELIRFVVIVVFLASQSILLALIYRRFGEARELLNITKNYQELLQGQQSRAARTVERLPEQVKEGTRQAVKEVLPQLVEGTSSSGIHS